MISALRGLVFAAVVLPAVRGFAQGVTPPARLAVPCDGEPFAATLAALGADGTVTFQIGDQRRPVAAKDLVRWGEYRDTSDGTLILLSDGGRLAAEVSGLRDEWLDVHSRLWGDVKLPLSRVRGIIFDPPHDPLRRDRLALRIQQATGNQDQLWLDNGEVAAGNVLGLKPAADGEAAGQWVVTLSTQGRELALPLDRLDAVVFNPALIDAAEARPAAHGWFGFRDGSLLRVLRATPSDTALALRLAGAGAITVQAVADRVLAECTYLRPATDRVTYLSDLKPAAYRHIPMLETERPLAMDRNVLGGRLRAGGVIHEKGLGMASTARVAYDLDGLYRRLEARLALDDAAGFGGSVTFRVFLADASGAWKQVYESATVRGAAPPVTLSVELREARRLALIVDYADRGDVLDYADCLDARLVR